MLFPPRPIGVFDSGIGGLSVLQALRQQLPHERFVYLADSGHAPYGDANTAADCALVQQRARAIAAWLRARHNIKALVIACNTATAAAADMLRACMPDLPIVGVEPALKPAARLTRTGHVGVLATRATLGSTRFARLLQQQGSGVQFHLQACDGLARAIERGGAAQQRADPDAGTLCVRYARALGPFGTHNGAIDTLVLGCTHYAFMQPALRASLGPVLHLLETGAPVARHTQALLRKNGLLADGAEDATAQASMRFFTTAAPDALRCAVQHWLQIHAPCCAAVAIAPGDAA